MSKKIAILATHGFEESELKSPKEYIEKKGWKADIISPKRGTIKSWAKTDWGPDYKVDKAISEARVEHYDGLILPGGVLNPDELRTNQEAIQLVKDFFTKGKPIAAICHGPQIMINAGIVMDVKMTSIASISQDLKNAGAYWQDSEVVVDDHIITSRTPKDLPAFNKKIGEIF